MSTKIVVPSLPANSDVEFRSYSDDAWYSVRLALDGDKLSVKYCGMDNEADEVFVAGQFKSLEELEKFQLRFRPLSLQLQDEDCRKVVEGSKVCASHSSVGPDVRFYDAVVEHVTREIHSSANGEEQCLCSFILLWQHGPHADALMEKKVENICFVQSNVKLNPYVASFVKIARQKIEGAACKYFSASDGDVAISNTIACSDKNGSPSVKQKSPIAQRLMQSKCAKWSHDNIWSDEGKIDDFCETNRQDNDVGGNGNYQYTIWIENLEKELSPSTITDFIHQRTKITSRVPWVVGKSFSQHDLFKVLSRTLMLTSQNRNVGISHQLRIVQNGTEEYRTAKKLKDLFMEFISHQKGLHKRLALEERKISQPSPAL